MVPNPLIKIAGSEIYVSREALAAHRGTDTDGGTDAGTGAGSMETEAQEHNAEMEKWKVDALSSMNDARLEQMIGTDNYMALIQALDMTVASGQAKEAQKAQESVIASGTADAQETDRQRRARQRSTLKRKRDEEDEKKKAKKKKEDENKAGPSGNSRNDQIKREKEQIKKQRQITKAEALTKMMELTGLTRKECVQALAIQTEAEPDRDFIEIYWSACHMLLEDGDPSKEGYANLVKGFQG
jgi:hypothetical protein